MEYLDVVTATVELMIAEMKCKPAKRTWLEDATANWPVEFIRNLIKVPYPNNVLIGIRQYCEVLPYSQLAKILTDEPKELQILADELRRLIAMNQSHDQTVSKEPTMESPVPQNNPAPLPETMIRAYFAKLPYPAIKEIKACLFHPQGDVYLVKFEKKKIEPMYQSTITTAEGKTVDATPLSTEIDIPNAYAIVIGDKVVGYHEEFWVDADRYRLALKQHLGLLAMEAAEEAPSAPTNAVEAAPRPPAPEGHVCAETVDAIVTRYEEMLLKASMEVDQTAQAAMQREADLTSALTDAQLAQVQAETKLALIRDVMDGKKFWSKREKLAETDEEATILMDAQAAMVDDVITSNQVYEMPKYNDAPKRDQCNGTNRLRERFADVGAAMGEGQAF